MFAKAIAGTMGATFLDVSPADITSKFTGNAEKAVKAVFLAARACQPTVLFVDEIDALIAQRGGRGDENDAKIKNQILR